MCHGSIEGGVIKSVSGEQGKWQKALKISVDCSFISNLCGKHFYRG